MAIRRRFNEKQGNHPLIRMSSPPPYILDKDKYTSSIWLKQYFDITQKCD